FCHCPGTPRRSLRCAGWLILRRAGPHCSRLALAHRLPTSAPNGEHTAAGHLMSFGPDQPSIFRRAAYYVDRILKGATPSDMRVEQPPKYDFAINPQTANAIGLTVPPSLLARADKVIE